MALEIKRIQDRVILKRADVNKIVREYVERETGRNVDRVEFHLSRDDDGDIDAVTSYLTFED